MKQRHGMKKFFVSIIFILLLLVPSTAMAQTMPDKIQEYAESYAFDHFKDMAGFLGLDLPVKVSDLKLGEGFTIYGMSDNLFTAKTLSDVVGDECLWLYLITDPEDNAISFLQIYDSPELSSSGGGDSSSFAKAAEKMRELIRKSGGTGDFRVLLYEFDDYFLVYSFNGDERVLHVNPLNFNMDYLTVKNYHELPTGEDALAAIQAEQSYYRKLMEENGGQPLYGGTNIQLSLHQYTSPLLICLIALAVTLPLLTVGIVLRHRKRIAQTN